MEVDLTQAEKRIAELEAAIMAITYLSDDGGIYSSFKEDVDLGEIAPVIKTVLNK